MTTPLNEKATIKEAVNQLRMRIDHDGPCECHQHALIARLNVLAALPAPRPREEGTQ